MKPWEINEEVTLRQDYERGYSLSDIASKLGRTYTSCYSRAKKLGIPLRSQKPFTTEEIERIKTLCKEGKTAMQIASMIHRNYWTIQQKIWQMGIAPIHEKDKKGRMGEFMAQTFLERDGFTILKKGSKTTPYDFIVQKANITYAIDATYQESPQLRPIDFRKLSCFGKPVVLWLSSMGIIWCELVEVKKRQCE